jgi:hypothetical protein
MFINNIKDIYNNRGDSFRWTTKDMEYYVVRGIKEDARTSVTKELSEKISDKTHSS